MTVPFAGLRVLDLADRSAALAGRILADLGATVTMIEPPTGATIRRHGPRFGDESAAHHYFSANKRSMTVDLATEPDVLRGLVADADVLIDTERPGRLDALGLGHHALRAVNPRLVQCSVTPFGLHGEWRHWKATDLTSVAAGGLGTGVTQWAFGGLLRDRATSSNAHGRGVFFSNISSDTFSLIQQT